MNRREFHSRITLAAGAVAVAPVVSWGRGQTAVQQDTHTAAMRRLIEDLSQGDPKIRDLIAPSPWRRIGLLAFPGMFPLDLLGPKAVFEDLLNTHIHIIGKTKAPIPVGQHTQLLPDCTLANCPEPLDVLLVPGGGLGPVAMMRDQEVLTFLRQRTGTTRYLASVCTGSLILGAAGLLRGRRATTHWVTMDTLTTLGATPVIQRVVEDGNIVTGAGVTAGLDLAFVLAARLAGPTYAKAVMLNTEYDPAPPFRAGTPGEAGELVTDAMRRVYRGITTAFEQAAVDAVKRWG